MIKKQPVILIVDDDKNTRDGLERALRSGWKIILAESGESALRLLAENEVDILLSDIRMPGMDGLALLQKAVSRYPDLICILMTAYGNVETAVEAVKKGAYDFLMKPVHLDDLDVRLKRALRSRDVESENARLREELQRNYALDKIVGNSSVMHTLFDTIRQTAPTQATVLIQGESGTGKELVAHAVHGLSSRAKGPFVAVNCAALSSSLLESELFGHEKGAFTGAVARRKGRFELADGGTLFLDEISEIDASVQVKLLRVLEEQRFERVGGDRTIEVDMRLIVATNKNLKKLVEEGNFREDLFFRLDVVNIFLPPLRDRRDDIPLLCEHFLQEHAKRNNRNVDGITTEAVDILSQYDWPGNVRELRNVVEKMMVLSQGRKITVRDIPHNIRAAHQEKGSSDISFTASIPSGSVYSLVEAERRMIAAALRKSGNNITKAAKDLGISRRTLHRKLNDMKAE